MLYAERKCLQTPNEVYNHPNVERDGENCPGVLSGTRITKALSKIHDGHRCHTAASVKATLKRRFKKTAAIKPNGRISSERPEIII